MRSINSRSVAPASAVRWFPVWRRSWKWMAGSPAASSAGSHTRQRKLLGRSGAPPARGRLTAAGRGGSAGRSLPLKEKHDLRGADGPDTRHREAADDPPALGRIAVERALQVLWTELAGPPAVFLRQHFVFHGLPTSSRRPANCDFYRIPTALSRVLTWDRPALAGFGEATDTPALATVRACSLSCWSPSPLACPTSPPRSASG